MAKLDLDALRAEADMTPHEVTLGGEVFRLRARLPLEFAELLNEGKLSDAMRLLLIDPAEWETMRLALPDDQDLTAIAEMYAVALPELQASQRSSPNGKPSLRPTSPSTIPASASPRRASGRPRSGSAGSTP
jgi:hypothetical protein